MFMFKLIIKSYFGALFDFIHKFSPDFIFCDFLRENFYLLSPERIYLLSGLLILQ